MHIYLASLSSAFSRRECLEQIKKQPPKYILESFVVGEPRCLATLKMTNRENFLLDSGAYSFMSGASCTLESMNDYVQKYAEFIKKYQVKQYFELDVDNVFGIKQVEEWRKYLESFTNVCCIPVWHAGRGIEYYKQMCKNYEYIAIGGLVFHLTKREWPAIKKMVDWAYFRGNKVHGLGFTKTSLLPYFNWYSVDSASWILSAVRGSQVHKFTGDRIVNLSFDRQNHKCNQYKIIIHNYYEWLKYQNFMDGRY